MDNLPLELFHLIFDYLNIIDLFQVRCVSKNLKFAVSEFKVNQLMFLSVNEVDQFNYNYDKRNKYHRLNWFFINKPINYRNSTDGSKLFILYRPLFKIQFLKCLKIYTFEKVNNHKIGLNDINKLINLEILEINLNSISHSDSQTMNLYLPNLRSLYFVRMPQALKIEIDTPKLEALSYVPSSLIHFTHSKSIRHLRLYMFDKRICGLFENLKCLELCRNNLVYKYISSFKNLNALKLHYDNSLYGQAWLPINRLMQFIEKQNLIKFYYSGLQVSCFHELLNVHNNFKSNKNCPDLQMKFYIRNLEFADENIFWIKEINYPLLMEITDELAVNFFHIFTDIQYILINSEFIDQAHLNNFILSCNNLSQLAIESASLPQQFYDNLPHISSLCKLDVKENKIDLNFNFIMRIHYLESFKTNQVLPITFVSNIEALSCLKIFEFKINKINVCIRKKENAYYFDNCEDNKIPGGNFNFQELIMWCKKLNNLKDEQIIRTRSGNKFIKKA